MPAPSDSLNVLLAAELGPQLQTEHVHDPFGAGWLTRFRTDRGAQVCWGQVVDVIPAVGAYRVNTGPRSFIWCSYLGSGYQPHGVRPITSIPIGSFVFFLVHPETPYTGIILGADPVAQLDDSRFRADYTWQGSNIGILADSSHRRTLEMPNSGGACNWSAGRPIDQTSIGEWGAMTETGAGVFLDPFMAYLRMSEETGLFAFFFDQLIRLAGHNLQIRSSLGELEDLDDESEAIRRQGLALYFWENLGLFLYGNPSRTLSGESVQSTQTMYSVLEPSVDNQQPFHRFQEFGGYLGQGGRRSTALPPTSPPATNTYPSQLIFPGGWEEQRSADGGYSLRSAQSIIIAKRPVIPIPKQIYRQEDTSGDTASNYNACGGLNGQAMHWTASELAVPNPGAGPTITTLAGQVAGSSSASQASAYIVAAATSLRSSYPDAAAVLDRINQTVLTYPSSVVPHLSAIAAVLTTVANQNASSGVTPPPANLLRAAGVMDFSAYVFNWKALHPFFYHTNDWYLPDESAMPINLDLTLPSFPLLATSQYLAPPAPIELPIDHRYGNSRVYPNEAGIALLPDGGISIYDGYGAEIRLTGGSAWLTCPGDVWLQPGKNVNCYAGWDFIARAQNSADITAAQHDVRLKAENNLMALAGNNGCGGMLFESRAHCPGYNYQGLLGEDVVTTGIVFKAPAAQVVAWGRDVILWGDPRDYETNPSYGQIILDTPNRVKVYAATMDRFLTSNAFDFFLDGSNNVVAANEYWPDNTALQGTLSTTNGAAFDGCVFAGGSFVADNGTFVSSQAATYNNQVSPLDGQNKTDADNLFATIQTRSAYLNGTVGPPEVNESWRDAVYTAAIQSTFSLRTTAQYKTTGLMLFESRWQQLARISGTSMPVWNEPSIAATAGTTYPHPGLENWASGDAYYELDWGLYVFGSGGWRSADRHTNQAEYEAPSYREANAVNMAGAYTVVMSP